MKTIIAGSRIITDQSIVNKAIVDSKFNIIEVVLGGARGVDDCGLQYARENNLKFKIFVADWASYGKAAGPIRNRQMAEYAEQLILVWDGISKGSKNMKEEMNKLNKPIFEVVV